MAHIFNFTQATVTGTSFLFGDTGSGPYYDFNFTESGYTPSYDFTFGEAVEIYSILKGPTNDFIAIWTDADAGLNNGKMYIASEGYLTIIDLSDNSVFDWYSESRVGRANESLENSDIIDINVS